MLAVDNLCLGYDSEVVARDLNFVINEKDYLCVVGENGSGKTTLIKTILGLQKQMSGTITFSDDLDRKELGYLPQQSLLNKDFPATVYEIVLSGFQTKSGLRPFYTKKEKELALEKMKKMSIENLKDRSFKELSGGQQQRVLLSRALCAAEKVLVLDEPVAGLDTKVSAEMYELLKQLNNEGMTIIMISHDVQTAIKYASHILHIGNSNYFGTTKDYLNSEYGKHLSDESEGDQHD